MFSVKILKNKKFFAGAVSLFLLFVLIIPVLIYADTDDGIGEGLVRCGNTVENGVFTNKCDFGDFIGLINRIINWIISIAGVIFTIMAIYGGFLYMTSSGDSGKKGKARDILLNTLLGFVIILCSWLIVYTLLKYLIPTDSNYQSIFKFL